MAAPAPKGPGFDEYLDLAESRRGSAADAASPELSLVSDSSASGLSGAELLELSSHRALGFGELGIVNAERRSTFEASPVGGVCAGQTAKQRPTQLSQQPQGSPEVAAVPAALATASAGGSPLQPAHALQGRPAAPGGREHPSKLASIRPDIGRTFAPDIRKLPSLVQDLSQLHAEAAARPRRLAAPAKAAQPDTSLALSGEGAALTINLAADAPAMAAPDGWITRFRRAAAVMLAERGFSLRALSLNGVKLAASNLLQRI
ncbi:MAG TPA: hypothetical protein VF559_03055 [Caulobacteraceae bacterium]